MRPGALIVGGGPAGAVAALMLARAGAPHLLIERTRETGDALCGGFLSWRTLATLERLGVTPAGARIERVRLFAGGRRVEAALPRPATGISRRALDTLLLGEAERAGARVERGLTARAVEDGAVRTGDGARLTAQALFLATGKHDLRGVARPPKQGEPTLGLRVRLAETPGLRRLVAGAIELHLFDGGYAGLCLHEDGTGNLCMAVRRSRLQAAGSPAALLAAIAAEAPRLGERLDASGPGPADAVANVPYGWRATESVAGLFRLGDQAAVIPSLAGEGMGIAIASGARAATAYLAGGAAAAAGYQRALARATRLPVALAWAAWRVAERPCIALPALALAALRPAAIESLARVTRIGESPIDASPAPSHMSARWSI